ncbi:MAG: Zn-dependent exopeptidase M28 [Oscillospiraceae bacterium]|jgi:hypothetical protein|nr:Zn-dependent exopeptidase M28 [Oscillospiraceae bacterium]
MTNPITDEARLQNATQRAIRSIENICQNIGPRLAGSAGELAAEEALRDALGGAIHASYTEAFPIVPGGALPAYMKRAALLILPACVAYGFGWAAVSAAMSVFLLFGLVLPALFFSPVADVTFRKKDSHNVTCVRKPSGEVRRRIILCGHADANPHIPLFYYGYKYLHTGLLGALLVPLNALAALALLGFSVAALRRGIVFGPAPRFGTALGNFTIALICMLPLFWGAFTYGSKRRVVPGATDNLSGCVIAQAVPLLLEETGVTLEHTEVVALFTGAEECGVRGARAWCKAHAAECKEIETLFVAIDTIHDMRFAVNLSGDMMGAQKYDPRAVSLIGRAAQRAGCPMPEKICTQGAIDAHAAAQTGIPAGGWIAADLANAPWYHTRDDSPANLNAAAIATSISIAMETVLLFDAEGLGAGA